VADPSPDGPSGAGSGPSGDDALGRVARGRYRADIDGLRAVAVLSVVCFHAFPEIPHGGFIGVDVFFVISGFLITANILAELDRGRFTLQGFYGRRVRRIFPALLVVLVCCLAFGWLQLLADEYEQLNRHAAGGAGFASNFLLWAESGYFDNAGEKKVLLHLWSLAIEEQFYILWPLSLLFAWKRRWNVAALIAAVGTLSFAVNVGTVAHSRTAAFYSPLARFWELMIGGLLACVTLRRPGWGARGRETATSLLGVTLLASGILAINRMSAFPGWWAVLPTAGTALLIAAGPGAWPNRTILSSAPLVWFGLISYPLYLWHWPLLSFGRILHGGAPAPWVRTVLVLVSIALAWLTYRFVERPLRFGAPSRARTGALVAALLVVGAMGFEGARHHGYTSRPVVKAHLTLASGFDGGYRQTPLIGDCGIASAADRALFANCLRDSRGPARFALLGDSKAAALFPGLIRTSTEDGRWLFVGGASKDGGMVPVLSAREMYRPYQRRAGLAVDAVVGDPGIHTVALAAATRSLFAMESTSSIEELPANGNYEAALDGLGRAADRLVAGGKTVVLVVDNPTLPDPRDCIKRVSGSPLFNRIFSIDQVEQDARCRLDLARHVELSRQYADLLLAVRSRHPDRISIFDTTRLLCDLELGACLPYSDGRLLYSYTDHISDFAAGRIGAALNAALRDGAIGFDPIEPRPGR
jgi:peptidoglycan/LPS O-acetylase OafA/YrhL